MTMIQSLLHSVGLYTDQMRVLDFFRIKRKAINYTGEDADIARVEACIAEDRPIMPAVRKKFELRPLDCFDYNMQVA